MEKKSKVAFTVIIMMGATLLSKVLGLLRTVIMANNYGTGIEAQAFSEASHIPLTIFDLAFSAAVLGCFIPVYNSIKENSEKKENFALNFFNVVLLASSFLALLGIIFSPLIINVMAPGLDANVKELSVRLLRIMFPMIIFTGGTFTLVGLMQSKGSYILPASVSAISNGCVVIYLLFFDKLLGEKGIYGLAIVYLIAWSIQLLTLAIPLRKKGFRFGFLLNLKDENLLKSLKMAPSIMFGSWMSPFSVLIGLFFATLIPNITGANTIFDYSYTTFTLIAGILTYSICNYSFPLLSRSEGEEWEGIVRKGLCSTAAIILPFVGAVAILAGEGISIMYMRGAFSPESAELTSRCIRFMLIGMPSFAIIEITNRIFYSEKNTLTPMISAIVGIVANIALTCILVFTTSLGITSLALGYAFGLLCASVCLLTVLIKKHKSVFNKDVLVKLVKIILSTLLSVAVMIIVYRLKCSNPFESGLFTNIINAVIVFIPGALVYLASLKIAKII